MLVSIFVQKAGLIGSLLSCMCVIVCVDFKAVLENVTWPFEPMRNV